MIPKEFDPYLSFTVQKGFVKDIMKKEKRNKKRIKRSPKARYTKIESKST